MIFLAILLGLFCRYRGTAIAGLVILQGPILIWGWLQSAHLFNSKTYAVIAGTWAISIGALLLAYEAKRFVLRWRARRRTNSAAHAADEWRAEANKQFGVRRQSRSWPQQERAPKGLSEPD